MISDARVGVGSRVAVGGRGEFVTAMIEELEGVSDPCGIGRNGS